MLLQFCQFIPNPAIFGLLTRNFISPVENPNNAFSLCSFVSEPATCIAFGIAFSSAFPSSLKSHHIRQFSILLDLISSAHFDTLLSRLSFLASRLSFKSVTTLGISFPLFVSPVTFTTCTFKAGNLYLSPL